MEARDLVSLGWGARGQTHTAGGDATCPWVSAQEDPSLCSLPLVLEVWRSIREEERCAAGLREPTRALFHSLLSPNSLSLSRSEML